MTSTSRNSPRRSQGSAHAADQTSSTGCRTPRPTPATAPHSTAVVLLERFGPAAQTRRAPVWLEWRGQPECLDVRQVADREGLFGHTVAADWDGGAVVGTGRFRSLDPSHEPPAVLQPGFSGGLTMACAVHRDGGVGWHMRLPDGASYDRVPEEGFMLDVLRRAVGLPTPPPSTSIAPLEIGAWFMAIAEASQAAGRPLEWQETLRLHPALGVASVEDGADPRLAVRDRDRTADWDLMRSLVAAGLASTVAPDPRIAAWMDAGMFSRWVLDGLPSLPDLLQLVRPHLSPESLRHVHHLARALDDRDR